MVDLRRFGPSSRLRIYTKLRNYARVIVETLARRSTKGSAIEELETALTKMAAAPFAVAMPMARTAIHFVLKTLIQPGQKVILSPYTIADVVNMVVSADGIPVFADIQKETCNIDPSQIEELIDSNTGAVLVTHFYGLLCDMPRIVHICRERGVPLVEDAAQAFGAQLDSKPAGSFGDAGIYSFGMYKPVNSFFGGMIVTNRQDVYDSLRRYQCLLMPPDEIRFLRKVVSGIFTDIVTHPLLFSSITFWIFRYAFLHDIDYINNLTKIDVCPKLMSALPREYLSRMSELQGRLVLDQLPAVERLMNRRIEAAKRYHEGLNDLSDLLLPPLRTDGSHNYWYYPIQFKRRHDLVGYAMRRGRDITESYHRNCADLSCFERFYRECPNARLTASSLIYLPTYPRYPSSEIDKNISVIRRYFGKA